MLRVGDIVVYKEYYDFLNKKYVINNFLILKINQNNHGDAILLSTMKLYQNTFFIGSEIISILNKEESDE
jgi:hypothetical protein